MKKDVEQILRERRKSAEEKRNTAVEKAHEKSPKLKEIDDALDVLSLRLIQASVGAIAEGDLEDLKREFQQLEDEKDQVLKAARLTRGIYKPKYFCKKCDDKGFVDQRSCSCRDAILRENAYEDSNIMLQLETENFKTFDLTRFREGRQPKELISPRENMKKHLDQFVNEYVPYFDEEAPSLYFFGPTGTGKTFMTNCIVKEILDQSHSVLYQTATELIDFLIDYSFMYARDKEQNRAKRDFIYDCDLLVIDDLGTEFVNDKSKSTLFELINARQLARKPMIISSNLQPDELTTVYDARTASRIRGKFIMFEFYGNDLRQ